MSESNSNRIADWATLRARFKTRQAETGSVFQNWQVRVHRSLSWMKRATEFPDDLPDAKLLLFWIALNALYGRWDPIRGSPAFDSESRDRFVENLCGWSNERIGSYVRFRRSLIKKLLENFFLSNDFWRDPTAADSKSRGAADAKYLEINLRKNDYCCVLQQALDRVYVLRGQLAHGAATANSRLNRKALLQCLDLLAEVVPLAIEICIEHGTNHDWPDLCYPPIG